MMSFYQIWNTFDNITFIDEMRAHNFALAFRSVQDQKYWKHEHKYYDIEHILAR